MESLTTRFQKEVFNPYLSLVKSQYRLHSNFDYVKSIWEEKLTPGELLNGPYLEKSQVYASGTPFSQLPVHPDTAKTINAKLHGRRLYKHQTEALDRIISKGKNVVVATGTSSGKTLCYQVPILDDLIKDPSPGLRAIIIYPLNALVNDQLNEWEEILQTHGKITFARFTGQTPDNQEEYESRWRNIFREQTSDHQLTQQEAQRETARRLQEQLDKDKKILNRLNHREMIRHNPPHILITNFSMLEYLLERPVDAPIFEKARLKFLVLDEAHAYRGVQATEIAFLIRRVKDRLGLSRLTCMATSATLGKQGDAGSKQKVAQFATALFGDNFETDSVIHGETAIPEKREPAAQPSIQQYITGAGLIRSNAIPEAVKSVYPGLSQGILPDILMHDRNLYRLRQEILTKPKLLKAAAEELWPGDKKAEEGLQALLEIVAAAKGMDSAREDLLPTRLHYFIKAQDGLYACLHMKCPGRNGANPAIFISAKNNENVPAGDCPFCREKGSKSKLVELVSCRKCGYLFGALQDLGPKRAQSLSTDDTKPHPDSFTTDLGWSSDSFWSYFSIEGEFPYPEHRRAEEDEESTNKLLFSPDELEWCVVCAKKRDKGEGDNCKCEAPHLRKIQIFHRQCPSDKYANLFNQRKNLLTTCPNCSAKNSSGLEPLRRFQESDDETGLAMAIPLAHFELGQTKKGQPPARKLLCFTDHRQRAAAFPSLLEEETFIHDIGRKMVGIVDQRRGPLTFVALGELLAEIADSESDKYDPDLFLPVSRLPDEDLDAKGKRDLWVAEVFGYFGIPDSARESAEDLGLIAVEYQIKREELEVFQAILSPFGLGKDECSSILQILLGFIRKRKAFTLPKGRVQQDSPAFGLVSADIGFDLLSKGVRTTRGWLTQNKSGSYRDNFVTDFLMRVLQVEDLQAAAEIGRKIWDDFLTKRFILDDIKRGVWKLDCERLAVVRPNARYVCDRCSIVTTYLAKQCCIRRGCKGTLNAKPFAPEEETIIARWVAGVGEPQFKTLKSEEHTAQINKDLAKIIEDRFRQAGREEKAEERKAMRQEGVNLLSSTTTFEMGINIGDLQKVLLRNAPPTSASYVQRIGRAGRGGDKNAVCVTLCRRTKYDSDAWKEPTRLMSGEVRTPSVFVTNKIIAQRHFNAVIFARFLRVKVMQENLLGQVKQKIDLEPLIPPHPREKIPNEWKKVRPFDLYLDFVSWLNAQAEEDIFTTDAGRSLQSAIGDFQAARLVASSNFQEILSRISDELSALLEERDRFHKQGASSARDDVERAIKDMISSDAIAVLAKRGFLPRYAFPLDVVTLETGRSRWLRDPEVELSRDRGLAIAEFAPGAQVIAHKKVFTSAGLYVGSSTDKPNRRWFSKCPGCEQIRTSRIKSQLVAPCSVCARAISEQYIDAYVEPIAFSVKLDKRGKGGERYRRSTLVRQRQSVTHFIDFVEDKEFTVNGPFSVALKREGALFRYNGGPNNQGFMLCPECGYSEPINGYKPGTQHERLRSFSGSSICSHDRVWTAPKLSYGHEFKSYCLIARPSIAPSSIESLAYSLQQGLCKTLEIESSDIGVSWRWRSNKTEEKNVEIVLYDLTPGGAGFVEEGYSAWRSVMENARSLCKKCVCETACYDCLKSYSNQLHHEKLDRLTVVRFFDDASF